MPLPEDVRAAYDEWAAVYDTNDNRTRDLNARVLRDQLETPSGARVLEIGCGTGINTAFLAEHAGEVVAVDLSERMLERARQRVSSPFVRFMCADVTAPWPVEGPFDLVVATLVLEHVADVPHVFREAARMLRGGGMFYVSELHPFKQLLGSQARFVEEKGGEEVRVPVAVHSISEFLTAAMDAGFVVRRVGEWPDEPGGVPRLLTLLFLR